MLKTCSDAQMLSFEACIYRQQAAGQCDISLDNPIYFLTFKFPDLFVSGFLTI